MPTTPRPGLPYVWVTWINAILAGDAHCEYAPWFRAHFKFDKQPRDTNLVAWQLEHTALLGRIVAQLKTDGWAVTLEHQNAFKLTGKSAILAGKPDIIARKGERVRVLDAKTGQPALKDWIQVAIYLIVIPLVWHRPDLSIEGELVYQTHTVSIRADEAIREVRDRLFALLRKLGGAAQPETVPSQHECVWCDIAACPDRWTADEQPADALTANF